MKSSGLTLAGRLALNGLRFQYLRRAGHPGKPQALSLEITHHCIAKCIMCNIWKIPREVPDLSVNQWLRILDSPVFSNLRELDITGGEPYLVKDLPHLFAGIRDLKSENLKALRSIAITTNGILTQRVLAYTEAILQSLNACNVELVVVCAVDAAGPLHNRIRRVEDAWSKVHATLQGLIKIRSKFPNLVLGLKTTILPANVDLLDNIADYAAASDLFTIMSPCIITQGRYLNPEKAADMAFNAQQIQKMIQFYLQGRSLWRFHNEQIIRFLKTGTLKKPCTCGFNYFFIRYDGTLLLCPLVDIPMGNVTESNLEDLLSPPKACGVRRRIGRFPDCSRCTEPGLERFSLPFEGWTYLKVLRKMKPEAFFQMHRHMGLDKYFS
ncbi:MAG: radical SAM protein [Deltaproteobacteria bacterium]|nr:radical SAM protein [Deltaproteobacteria bacterium]